eukprot:3357404-Amphidinium_carterae.1
MEELVVRLSKPGLSLSADALGQVEILAVVCPQYLSHLCAQLINKHPDSPVLWQYSGDCTPVRGKSVTTLAGLGGKVKHAEKQTL